MFRLSSDIQPLDVQLFGACRPSWRRRRPIGRRNVGVPAEVLGERDTDRIDAEGLGYQAPGTFLDTAPSTALPSYIMIEVKPRALWGIDKIERFLSLGYEAVHQTKDDMHFALPDGAASETPNSATAR